MKLTSRLGKKGLKISDIIKKTHGLIGPLSPWNGIEGSELYYGQSYDGEPTWKGFIEGGLDENLPKLKNQGAAAILFIPIDDRYLVYIFGYGLGSLVDGKTEWDFGIKVVLNTIDANAIRSLDSKTLNRKAKSKRVQLAAQGSIAEFDLDIMQDLVSQIAGVSFDNNFAKGLVGSESLMLTVDMEGSSLAKKTKEIYERYNLAKYKGDFEWIDFVSPVKDNTLVENLDIELAIAFDTSIKSNNPDTFLLSYPEIVDHMAIDHICYHGFGSFKEFDFPEISEFLYEYKSNGFTSLVHDLKKLSIAVFDGGDTYKKSYSLYRSLLSEIEYNNNYYIFSNGVWFKLETNYYNQVTKFFDWLLKSAEYNNVGTTYHGTETDYLANYHVANHQIFDKIFYTGGSHKIEYADIISDKREIIHVKSGGSASNVSHLFNQGLVSARLMLNDINYRKEFKTKLATPLKTLCNVNRFSSHDITIVFRIIKSGKDFKLSFFSKITLYDTYTKIKAMGYKFRLEWVKY